MEALSEDEQGSRATELPSMSSYYHNRSEGHSRSRAFVDTMDSLSESETDERSPSLPSLSASLQHRFMPAGQLQTNRHTNQQTNAAPSCSNAPQRNGQVMTMKEVDAKLNELRRENFNLKLKLYFADKDKTGIVNEEYESSMIREMHRLEKALRAYQKVVDQKELEIGQLHAEHAKRLKSTEMEIELIKNEKDVLVNEVQVSTSVCKSLMSHLSEIREFWRKHLMAGTKGAPLVDNDLIHSLSQWFNTSDDILNSASVLITDDCLDYSTRRDYVPTDNEQDRSQTGNHQNHEILTSLIHFGLENEAQRRELEEHLTEYMKQKELLYHLSSESDDDWSEPNRDASKARIGLDDDHFLVDGIGRSTAARSLPRRKLNKRRSSAGMSSLGLLSDFSAVIANRNVKIPPVMQRDKDTQTNSENTATDMCVGTDKAITQDQCVDAIADTQEMEIQTEIKIFKEAEVQVDFVPTVAAANHPGNGSTMVKMNNTDFSNIGKLTTGSGDIHPGDQNSPQTLYTYKVGLSPVKNAQQKKSSVCSCKGDRNSIYAAAIAKIKSESSHSSSSSQSSITLDQNKDTNINNNNDAEIFKLPNDETYARIKKSIPSKNARTSLTQVNNNRPSAFTSSTSSIDYKKPATSDFFSDMQIYPRSLPKVRQSVRKDVAVVSKLLHASNVADPDLSSPDLGIGDSDHDLNTALRAYLSIYKYQLLRRQINEASAVLGVMDNLSRDYNIRLINPLDYHAGITQSLHNIMEIVKSTKQLCGQFTIEDVNTLYTQLEAMRSRKENMERAITRQLKKTDKLLKKAKVNLKES